ncbi:MAG: hypothetical protein GY803_14095 [Chloroflexi bacterium]|nr:hypothetical protein [Chloroflexota bacterium]
MAEEDLSPIDRIDVLLRFLPGFKASGRQSFAGWKTYYPVYDDDVVEFFKLAGHPWWMDRGYQINEAGAMLRDDAVVQSASLDEIKTMLTFCVRGERFSDGHWEGLLKDGRIQALLRRLQIIREELLAD